MTRQDEFTGLEISRQRKYQLRKYKIRSCGACGAKMNNYTARCDRCAMKHRLANREKKGCVSQQITGIGRPQIIADD